MYKLHTQCRACGFGSDSAPATSKAGTGSGLIKVFDLGRQPLANDFKKRADDHAGFAPLEVLYCPSCTLAQLSVVVDPKVLYSNYTYVTSPSQTMLAHFGTLQQDIAEEFGSVPKSVVEIGSNNGALLAFLKKAWALKVFGIDPALNLVAEANDAGVPSMASLFNRDSAMEALAEIHTEPDVILARHVFCHIDNWREFIMNAELLMHKESILCIEVPHAKNLIESCEWDTIYHEHLSYLTILSVTELLKNSNLKLHRVIRYPIHGGSVLLVIRRKDSKAQEHSSVVDEIRNEHCRESDWEWFRNKATDNIEFLKKAVRDLRAKGKTVAGFGASAKSTVMINACGFTRKDIGFITDTTPGKLYTCSPGTDIPIVDEGALMRDLPDYTLLFAWNFRSEVLDKCKPYTEKGGRFIVPHPTVEIAP